MIVPLRSLEALRRSKLDLEAFAALAAAGFPPLVYVFCRQTHHAENDLCARFFFEAHGVREDPATGNGAAFLGAYLLEHRFFPEPIFHCGSSKATRFVDLLWSCCALGWRTDYAKSAWAAM